MWQICPGAIREPHGKTTEEGAMKYLSVCSGIEAATVAWHPLGWQPVAFSEIEKFPSQVLQHHYPHVPNMGDMTKFRTWGIERGTIDVLVGGTPCQAFSLAGLRKGLQDPRGNLALTFVAMVNDIRPKWVVWENVTGVLSSNQGRDFGTFVTALGQCGYGWAYRILDSRHFGTPQRRRRVFLVANSGGSPICSAQVLFDPESLSRLRYETTETWLQCSDDASNGVGRRLKHMDPIGAHLYSHTLTGDKASTLTKLHQEHHAVLYTDGNDDQARPVNLKDKVKGWFNLRDNDPNLRNRNFKIRRLTPVEHERLQGFPDNYTAIHGDKTLDCHRYHALGNSMAVPVMAWIGKRINDHPYSR